MRSTTQARDPTPFPSPVKRKQAPHHQDNPKRQESNHDQHQAPTDRNTQTDREDMAKVPWHQETTRSRQDATASALINTHSLISLSHTHMLHAFNEPTLSQPNTIQDHAATTSRLWTSCRGWLQPTPLTFHLCPDGTVAAPPLLEPKQMPSPVSVTPQEW